MRHLVFFSALAGLTLALSGGQLLAQYERAPQKPAIVLAAFGTTEVSALKSILNVKSRIAAAFPGYDVHLAFTSNIIRDVWKKRAADKKFRQQNQAVPQEIYQIANPLTTLANIQEHGSRLILVQSLHVTQGEEFGDLKNIVGQLAGIRTMKFSLHPFPWLGLGEPALGDGGAEYLAKAAAALAPLVEEARKKNAALVLMGHGNEHLAVASYKHFEQAMQKMYGPEVALGLVEGEPGFEDALKEVERSGAKTVLLVPFMLVAGDHAKNDMAGDEEDSWASQFKAKGYTVLTRLEGLGSNNAWADIYVEHLKGVEKQMLEKQAADGGSSK
jgi:sirohydrochlorin cobaltochelatase